LLNLQSLLVVQILEAGNAPTARVIKQGLLCSYDQCLQPIWPDGGEPPVVPT
jgi:hypothetical protein